MAPAYRSSPEAAATSSNSFITHHNPRRRFFTVGVARSTSVTSERRRPVHAAFNRVEHGPGLNSFRNLSEEAEPGCQKQDPSLRLGTRFKWNMACFSDHRSATNTVLEQKEDDRMFLQNSLLTIESPSRSNERLRSAILNCICPECGGGLSMAAEPLRCRGRCGMDWRPVWILICQSNRSQSRNRLKPVA